MMSDPPPEISRLFLSFFRLGLTAFGGPAMIAYMRRMAVEKKRWLDQETFKAGVGLCQVIPGATAMQMAAYVGLKTRGAMGAAAAFIGFGLPAFFFMMVLSALYSRYQDLPAAISLFTGLQAIIVGIVANAALSFGGNTLKGWKDILIAFAAAILFAFHVSPILVIIVASLHAWRKSCNCEPPSRWSVRNPRSMEETREHSPPGLCPAPRSHANARSSAGRCRSGNHRG